MKKFLSLVLSLALVMGLTTTALAAPASVETHGGTVTVSDVISQKEYPDLPVFEVAAGTTITVADKYGQAYWAPCADFYPAEDTGSAFTTNYQGGYSLELGADSETLTFTADKPGTWYVNAGGVNAYARIGLIVIGDSATTEPEQPAEPEAPVEPEQPVQPEPPALPVFTDVADNSPFKTAIQWAVEQGITKGSGVNTFSPNGTCTTAHILTFLWRAVGSPVSYAACPVEDVTADSPFYTALCWANEKGLFSGDVSGKTPCTRASAVTYLWKLAGSPDAGTSSFADVPADASYAQAVAWAVEQGITKGNGVNTFSPNTICTRGQIVTFLYRDLA